MRSPTTKRGPAAAGRAQEQTANAFGRRLRHWRTERGVTLRDVSDSSGISIAYLSDLERGKLVNPTLDTLTALADALSVSLNELLGIEDEKSAQPSVPSALENFRQSQSFQEAVAAEASRWRMPQQDVEHGWLVSLAGIRIGRRAPRTTSDYQFIFEAARRVLE